MEAYCMKCKTKREIKDPVASFNAKGSPVTTGTCPVCGTKMFRVGRTDAHEGLTPPAKKEKPRHGKLVIVESPAKAKTVGRFLGKGYTVQGLGGARARPAALAALGGCRKQFRAEVPRPERKEGSGQGDQATGAATPRRSSWRPTRTAKAKSISWHLMEAADIEPGT